MKRQIALLNLVVILALALGACTAPAAAPAQPAAPAAPAAAQPTTAAAEPTAATATQPAAANANKKLTIALSVPAMSFPFFVFMESAVKDEAQKLGNIEITTLDGQNQVPKQTADLEAAIAKKVDGILVSPITADAMAPAVKEVVDAKIPVATIDRTVYNVDTLAHVGADNVLGGEEQGKALLKLFPNGATIFEIQGTPGATPAIDRSKGLHNIIDSHPEIKVACQQTGEFTRDKGLTVAENCLAATPNPDAIISANDDMAFGIAEALKSHNLAGKTVLIGYDALPESLAAVRDGSFYGTVDQFPGQQSREALRVLVDNLRQGTKPDKHDIFITPKLITKDNLQEAERIGEVPGGAGAAGATQTAPATTEPAAQPTAAPAAAAPATCTDKQTIALSVPAMSFPFFVFMESAVKDEAQKLGNIEITTLDGQNQVPKQTADLEAAIAKKVDGILVSPITADAMAPAVKEVVDAKIPVATIDRTVYNVDTLAHVGADNVLGGEEQGKALLKLFPNGATIFEIQGTPGATPAIDRSKGLHNIIDSHPEIKVACQQTGEFTRDKGLTVAENCLAATPNPDAIISANDDMAFGIAEALKSHNLAGKTVLIGYDALPESLAAVRDGSFYGTVDQFPGQQSREALRVLVDNLCGGKKPPQHDIFITPKLITKDNLQEAERIGEVK